MYDLLDSNGVPNWGLFKRERPGRLPIFERTIRAWRQSILDRLAALGVADYSNPIASILYAEDREPDWLVKDVLLRGGLNCIAGEPAAGKSYVTYTLSLALASGWAALSGIVPAGGPERVLYFDQENGEGDRNRYLTRSWNGLADNHGEPPDVSLLHENFFPVHFELGTPEWEDVASEFAEHFQPSLIVYDTAASCFGIENENDNAEASRVIAGIRRVAKLVTPTATTIVLKHAKSSEKNGERKMRGATMWQSLADQVMFQVRAPGRPRKDGLRLTRLVPDKVRAYGLDKPIFITPSYTDSRKTGLVLEASYIASRDHRAKLDQEEDEHDE